MASPEPPVALKNHCSVIHDGVLYVYSPDAFQTLPLQKNATWTQETNGVSVTGAICVKGGTEGNSADAALYIVGGTTNSSMPNYSGLQRYHFQDKTWQTISPMSTVTANRINHGATYLNASSAILVYGGSQSGGAGLSTETFLMLMYAPYRVQAYSSVAPAVSKPFVLPWTDDKAVMVGGSTSNQKVFTFHPDPGWVDLGVTLPNPLPDSSVAQCNIQSLDDGTKILQTYSMNQSPNLVTRNVLLQPGNIPAPYGLTIGNPTSSGGPKQMRRQLFQQNYPAYNNTNAPSEQRSGFAIADGGDIVAIVGGDANSSVVLFNSSGNSWVDDKSFFGASQNILTISNTTSSSSSSISSTPTSTAAPSLAATPSAVSSPTTIASSSDKGQSNGLAILGGVLGGICGLAAILIIFLLWLRSVKRRKAAAAAARGNNIDSSYPSDKSSGGYRTEGGTQPLSKQAQPMGRSPVPSTVVSESDSVAMFGGKSSTEKGTDVKPSGPPYGGSKLNPAHGNNNSIGGIFKNNKSTLNISKPMLPDLGDYKERPSIDLGNVTPNTAGAPALPPLAHVTQQKADQRKTDEGWAKYFTADANETDQSKQTRNRDTYASDVTSYSRPSTSKGGGGGFWPGSGVASPSNRSTKLPTRDSAGNVLNHYTVATASPSLEGPASAITRSMSVAKPAQAKFSSGDSISTDHSSDDGYEDEEIDNYSDYRGSKQEDNAWTPVGHAWPTSGRHSFRPESVQVSANDFIRRYEPPKKTETAMVDPSVTTRDFGRQPEPHQKLGNAFAQTATSIPTFPMPISASRREADTEQRHPVANTAQHPAVTHYATTVGHSRKTSNAGHSRKSSNNPFHGGAAVQDYFGPGANDTSSSRATSGKLPDSTDMSWLNLGTPAHMHGSPQTNENHDPA